MSTQKTPRQNILPNDTFYMDGEDGDWTYGDSATLIGKTDVGGDDKFYGASNTNPYTNDGTVTEDDYQDYAWFGEDDQAERQNEALGDAYHIGSSARGGNDYFLGGNYAQNLAAGDSYSMDQSAKGGNDTLLGGINSDNTLVGDAYGYMTDTARGGNDSVVGGDAKSEKAVNPYYDQEDIEDIDGDSVDESIDEAPERDISGDVYAYNRLIGDAYSFGGEDSDNGAIGGADIIRGGSAIAAYYSAQTYNEIQGDAYEMTGHGTGGNDTITGGDARAGVFYYQDDYESFGEDFGGGWSYNNNDDYNEWYEGDAYTFNLMNGDAYAMGDWAHGGNDVMRGGNAVAGNSNYVDLGANDYGADAYTFNVMAGDAFLLADHAHAGDDILTGGDATGLSSATDNGISTTLVYNLLSGDGFVMVEGTEGPIWFGNDRITGGNSTYDTDGQVLNLLFGDLGSASYGGAPPDLSSYAVADDGVLYGNVIGGSDILRGGSGAGVQNVMFGDALALIDGATGGFDTLYGGDLAGTDSLMYGDGYYIDSGSYGGKDTLISGSGVDIMWGDAFDNYGIGGADRFVFRSNSNHDVVVDYSYLEGDKIDLSGFNLGRKNLTDFKNFDALLSSGRLSNSGSDLIIDLDVGNQVDANSVTIVGLQIGDLSADMFVF